MEDCFWRCSGSAAVTVTEGSCSAVVVERGSSSAAVARSSFAVAAGSNRVVAASSSRARRIDEGWSRGCNRRPVHNPAAGSLFRKRVGAPFRSCVCRTLAGTQSGSHNASAADTRLSRILGAVAGSNWGAAECTADTREPAADNNAGFAHEQGRQPSTRRTKRPKGAGSLELRCCEFS